MASILIGALGSVAGVSGAGSVASMFGSQLLGMVTSGITNAAFSKPSKRHTEGARLEELAVQTSTYGRAIPKLYGSVRVAGNVIWARPMKEVANTTTVRSGGKGGVRPRQQTSSQTSYSYYATLAIAMGEGEISRLERVWADAKLLDLSLGTYRVYNGSETQLPDSVIESVEGMGRAPAYRGLAYVVIEDFPLVEFGNRIPNFTFEVTRQLKHADIGSASVEESVKSIMLLPGSGEYVFDTVVQAKQDGIDPGSGFQPQGYRRIVNANAAANKADALVAVEQMLASFPNLEWVGVVVNWFATSMDTATCEFFPCVEYNTNTQVTPNNWSVAGYNRSTARLIGYDGASPRYGGTPDDGSVLRLVAHLKSKGLKVFLYPMPLVDLPGKPWRGNITGTAASVANFFTRTNGYNRFIQHYADLVGTQVDAFAIGTEMRDLTAITSGSGIFPAVSQLVSLAAVVKPIVGTACKVTYAADWSEYHHTDGGWYHLDPLWASSNIDVVGIDAYFPLTDEPQASITQTKIAQGWTSGEGYDWFYSDVARTIQVPLAPAYAWKNIDWWWRNAHVNPGGGTTAWVPESKPVWFTEYGFPSVDGASNQPNVFVDASASGSAYPRFSRKRVDLAAQREAIAATETVWGTSTMVPRRFLWAFDARPYPAWPDLKNVWSDGANWITGHWVQGKLGGTRLSAIVAELLRQVGVEDARQDVSALKAQVDGFLVHQRSTVRALLEQLQLAYGFDLRESNGKLVAIMRGGLPALSLPEADCIPLETEQGSAPFEYKRAEESQLPKRVEVRYLDRLSHYGVGVQAAAREQVQAQDTETMALSLVCSEAYAKLLADVRLHERWVQRENLRFQLPIRYVALEPGDVITLMTGDANFAVKCTQTQCGKPGMLVVQAVVDDAKTYDHYVLPRETEVENNTALSLTETEFLDMPALPGDSILSPVLRTAMVGQSENWPGAVLLRTDPVTLDPVVIASNDQEAVIGKALSVLGSAPANVFDEIGTVDVVLRGDGALENTTRLAVLNGANAALLGNEVIQFANAALLSPLHYRLSGLLRGRLGTEWASGSHAVGERFVLLSRALIAADIPRADIGKILALRTVTFGMNDGDAVLHNVAFQAENLKPYAPVHGQLTRDGAGNITARWVRRARLNAEWLDAVDVPLDDVSERYAVEVMNGVNVVRTLEVVRPEIAYSAAEQVTDFGAAQNLLTLRVYQLSSVVGRGRMLQITG